MDKPTTGRDQGGRFAPGNTGGPGRSRGRGYELQRAAQEAVTPEHMQAMVRKALFMALNGNLAAMRFVAERTLGRAPEAPALEGAPIDITLPRLQTIDDCMVGIDRVQDALTRGAIPLEVAKALIDVVTIRVKAIEVRDLEKRLTELEKAAESVELPGRR